MFFWCPKGNSFTKKAKNSPFLGTPPTTPPPPISSSKTEELPSTGLQSTRQPSGSVVAVCAFRVLDELATWPAVFCYVWNRLGCGFKKRGLGKGVKKTQRYKDTKKNVGTSSHDFPKNTVESVMFLFLKVGCMLVSQRVFFGWYILRWINLFDVENHSEPFEGMK